MRAYKLQLLHHIKPDDHRKRTDFAVEMLSRIEENDKYLDLVLFSDESTFHVGGKVNRYNCRIWGNENPHQVTEYERDTPKLNVWLGRHKNGVIGPFFFMESTVTGHSYLDMLENSAFAQIQYLPVSYSSRMVPRLTSTEMLPYFWMRLFLDVGSEEEILLPGPLDLQI